MKCRGQPDVVGGEGLRHHVEVGALCRVDADTDAGASDHDIGQTLLRNAAMNAAQYKSELALIRGQNIDISNLASGIYFVKIETAEKTQTIQKIVKQ